MISLALLSYILIALFRDTPLATIGRPWPDGQMAINGHFGHIWPFMTIWRDLNKSLINFPDQFMIAVFSVKLILIHAFLLKNFSD